jgi:hypothetical protein
MLLLFLRDPPVLRPCCCPCPLLLVVQGWELQFRGWEAAVLAVELDEANS